MEEYKKKTLLGKGATAEVYLVEEVLSRRCFAMKISDNRELLQMEAGMLSKLTGQVASAEKIWVEQEPKENLAEPTATLGKQGNNKYFPEFETYLPEKNILVMEYLEGRDLQSVLDRDKNLEIGEVVYIIGEILQALKVLHEQIPPIVYRDVKPANIMLCRDGSVRLIDLGAACAIDNRYEEVIEGQSLEKDGFAGITRMRAGTYGYAAPEQFWEGARISVSCDLYSVGKVFAYLLTGKNPAEPPYDMENFCRGLCGKAASFMEVLERSLALSVQARYESAEEMWCAIQEAYASIRMGGRYPKRQKTARIYEKCIWKSEYRRIF